MRAARLVLLVLAAGWVALVLAAPLTALGVHASALTYAFGSLVCHQRPERSFHIAAAQLPVCARCLGLYIGVLLGLIVASRTLSRAELRGLLVIAALPTAVTWASEIAGIWSPSNATRFAAALPLGAVVAVTVNYVECVRPRRTEPSRPRIPI